MRLEATRSQLLGLAIASVLLSTAVWLRTVLVGHNWITFVLAEALVLALLWGLGLFVLTRYADEWGPYFVWNWRRKDDLDEDR